MRPVVQRAIEAVERAEWLADEAEGGDSGAMCTPAHEPVRALTTTGHQSLIVPAGGTWAKEPTIGGEPLPTQTAKEARALVVLYNQGVEARDAATEPTTTLTTRDRAALVLTDEHIDDCCFRMFALHEIANAMAMAHHVDGGEYVVTGNKRERMAQYGNAVTPPVMRWIVSRLLPILDESSAASESYRGTAA